MKTLLTIKHLLGTTLLITGIGGFVAFFCLVGYLLISMNEAGLQTTWFARFLAIGFAGIILGCWLRTNWKTRHISTKTVRSDFLS